MYCCGFAYRDFCLTVLRYEKRVAVTSKPMNFGAMRNVETQ